MPRRHQATNQFRILTRINTKYVNFSNGFLKAEAVLRADDGQICNYESVGVNSAFLK